MGTLLMWGDAGQLTEGPCVPWQACGSSWAGEAGGFAYVGPPRTKGSSHAAGSPFGFRSFACRLHGPALSSGLLLVVSWSLPSSTELDHGLLGSLPGPGLTSQQQAPLRRGECGRVEGRQSLWRDDFRGPRARWGHLLWHSCQQSSGVGALLSPFYRKGNLRFGSLLPVDPWSLGGGGHRKSPLPT